jgi:hypothetical protein
MKILKVGDTQKAICEHCKSFESVTFKLRDVPFSDKSGVVKNVLVGVCNKCDLVAVLPHQSTPAVKKQLDSQRKAIEVRVPAHMIDILSLASYELNVGPEFTSSIIKYYVSGMISHSIPYEGMSKFSKTALFKGPAQRRLSIKGRTVADDVLKLKGMTHIAKTSDLLKSVILTIHEDLLTNKNPRSIDNLKTIVNATV